MSVAILVSLGVWQLERLQWKLGLLAAIDAAEASSALPLPAGPAEFQKGYAEGTLRPTSGLYGSEVRDLPSGPVIGAYLIEPLDRPGQPTLLVNRGWVPTDGAVPPTPGGAARVEGYVRLPEPAGLFSAKDDPARRRFFSLDPGVIGPALGVSDPAPFTLVALGTPSPGVFPAPATALPRPPNDHLNYAITWFSLAVIAAVISVLQFRRMRRA